MIKTNVLFLQVYDRLNKLGIAVSYNRSLVVFKQIGDHYLDLLVRAAEDGKHIRFVGDNLNFSVGVHQETHNNHKHLVHMFASLALVSKNLFEEKSNVPQIPLNNLEPKDVLLSTEEYNIVKEDCVKIIVDILVKFLPQLSFMVKSVPDTLEGPETHLLKAKTEVIPLPVLPFNESCYQDDVKILDYYEDVVKKLKNRVEGMKDDTRIQIGGDQLTRERFSHAML